MSFAVSAAFQAAVFQALGADAVIGALVGSNIFDAVPAGPVSGTHIVLGEEEVRDRSDQICYGAEHRFVIGVFTDAEGFDIAKQVAGAVSDALVDAPLSLTRGRLVSLRFLRASVRRIRAGQTRRINMIFRAIVEDD